MKQLAAYLPGLAFFLAGFPIPAQPVAHAHWAVAFDPATAAPGAKALARITARIDPGWHLYSASSAAGIPASFQLTGPVVESTRLFQTQPKRAFDANFNTEAETYEGEAGFAVEAIVRKDAPAGPAQISVNGRFQTCSDTQCVPGKWSDNATLTVDPGAPAAIQVPAGYTEVIARPAAAAPAGSQPQSQPEQGLGLFLLAAFGFGLAAIFTPCCFPMIPITMSYFLNRPAGGRRDGVAQAVVFCLGIVVLFSGLGLITTAVLGPVGVKHLGSSPWVNGFIAALFMAFGLSLLGAFEITIPSAILTRLNASAGQGGYAGALLMGLTFSLSSFACVGPFVGTLLAASVGGGGVRPLAGMAAFASGLALPFFLLALFPGYLKRMPRSGGWLARVKVVMGFLILAASLKYLASVDQALGSGWLTRERFLAAWIVLFAMAGLYLLGFVRLEGTKPDETLGLGRLLTGMALVIFAISLAPGMAGGKLGELDAYVPAGSGSPGAAGTGLEWITDDYAGALARARSQGKLLFIDFTGIACTNCHWMRANMLSRPEVEAALGNFVLVELYTDRSDAVSERNEKLLEDKFRTAAEPFYAILDANERPIATFDRLTRDPAEYLAFLRQGMAAPGPAANAVDLGVPRTALDGAAIDTAGKVVVLDFWATYCEPCVREIPGLNKLYHELGPRGLAIVGVDIDQEDAELVKPFLAKHPMEYPVALGTPGLGTRYGVEGFPATLIFDRSGKLAKRFAQFTPEAEMRKAIEGLL
ncbi:MAG: cytochrome c biogenesis protein CcdA [Bryobacteraceae bacterium]|jgi:thiol:disulfide interchange protein DsbD